MKVYRVGGSVRDELIGVTPRDYDYVITGSNLNDMLEKGYINAHSTLPVFVHKQKPNSQFLLATRKIDKTNEKKDWADYPHLSDRTAKGATIYDSLAQRDFTMNSIAKCDDTDTYIDPHGGIDDIRNNIIRPISDDNIIEDPVRCYRAAMFMARFKGWELRPATGKTELPMVALPWADHVHACKITTRVIENGWDLGVYLGTLDKLLAAEPMPLIWEDYRDDVFSTSRLTELLINDNELTTDGKIIIAAFVNPHAMPGLMNENTVHKIANGTKLLTMLKRYVGLAVVMFGSKINLTRYVPMVTGIECIHGCLMAKRDAGSPIITDKQALVLFAKALHEHESTPISEIEKKVDRFVSWIEDTSDEYLEYRKNLPHEQIATMATIRSSRVSAIYQELTANFIRSRIHTAFDIKGL